MGSILYSNRSNNLRGKYEFRNENKYFRKKLDAPESNYSFFSNTFLNSLISTTKWILRTLSNLTEAQSPRF